MRRVVLLTVWLAAALTATAGVGATAEDITQRWPAGSIRTVEQAEAARSAGRAAESEAEQTWREQQAHCERTFFVNRCMESARRSHSLAQQQARRVQVEAGDVLRRADVEERRRQQAERERAAREDEERDRAARERAAAAAQQQRELNDPARAAGRADTAAANQARATERSVEAQRRADERAAQAPERQRNVQLFEERQRQARDEAARRAQQRAENEQRRARRQAEREAQAKRRAEAQARAEAARKE